MTELIIILIYNLVILTGCSYVVFGLGYSGWWFVLALCLLVNWKKEEEEEDDDNEE